MKIGFSALGFGVNDNLGGSAIVASATAIQLAERGHEVVYFCTNKKDKDTNLFEKTTIKKIKGVKVVYLKTYSFPFFKGSFPPHYIPKLKYYLDNERYFDVFHLNEYRSFNAAFITKWCVKNNIPFTIQPQGTLIYDGKSMFIKRLYDFLFSGRILKKAGAVIAVTHRENILAQELGVEERKVRVIPSGIDMHKYKDIPVKGEFRARFDLNVEKPIVLFVGRLDPIKGIDILISAFSKIKIPECKLVIVGPDHGSTNEIREQIKVLGLSESVIITGAFPKHKDVLGAMNDADIMVVPSRAEAFGMVILEASILKKPMIISENCNVSDFYNDAAIVVPLNSNKIAEAMTDLLTDKPLREKIGSRARYVVEKNFQLNKVVTQLEELFIELS